ncbi:hypothetical protein BJ912DRAFT_1040250 [Pholiota molesta]|nr:hypothetical protein BJ912DRAFT_1040250 [Pholiota molesta]
MRTDTDIVTRQWCACESDRGSKHSDCARLRRCDGFGRSGGNKCRAAAFGSDEENLWEEGGEHRGCPREYRRESEVRERSNGTYPGNHAAQPPPPSYSATSNTDIDREVPLRSDQATLTMFNGFTNSAIYGGHFVQNNAVKSTRHGLKHLQQRVAAAAFHNSAQRVYPPRCHPDTRTAVMQRIYNWIVQSEHREDWLLWLNGAAGAGKSAIMQSIAEDASRPLSPSLASSSLADPDYSTDRGRNLVYHRAYPLVFSQSLQSQLDQLIVQPLLALPTHLQRLFVILIDGLDECDDLVKEILAKSSGQFIYASVVVNYVSSPRPTRLINSTSSAVEALDTVLDVLALVMLTKITESDLLSHISAGGCDLTAIIKFGARTNPQPEIEFLHASLPDFLRDKSRSDEYYIDRDGYRTKLLSMLLKKPPPKIDFPLPLQLFAQVREQEYARLSAIGILLRKAKDSEQLRSAFMKFTVAFDNMEIAAVNDMNCIHILGHLRNLNLDDQGQIYHRVFDIFTREFAKCWPSLDDDVKDYLGNSPTSWPVSIKFAKSKSAYKLIIK